MLIIDSYAVAVGLCLVTMLCWGSWATTLMLTSLLLGFTLGSTGGEGRPFLADLQQASGRAVGYAVLGGVIFNLSNLLMVAATAVAGMAVAFPVAVGLALVIGVVLNFLKTPLRDTALLFGGEA